MTICGNKGHKARVTMKSRTERRNPEKSSAMKERVNNKTKRPKTPQIRSHPERTLARANDAHERTMAGAPRSASTRTSLLIEFGTTDEAELELLDPPEMEVDGEAEIEDPIEPAEVGAGVCSEGYDLSSRHFL